MERKASRKGFFFAQLRKVTVSPDTSSRSGARSLVRIRFDSTNFLTKLGTGGKSESVHSTNGEIGHENFPAFCMLGDVRSGGGLSCARGWHGMPHPPTRGGADFSNIAGRDGCGDSPSRTSSCAQPTLLCDPIDAESPHSRGLDPSNGEAGEVLSGGGSSVAGEFTQ